MKEQVKTQLEIVELIDLFLDPARGVRYEEDPEWIQLLWRRQGHENI